MQLYDCCQFKHRQPSTVTHLYCVLLLLLLMLLLVQEEPTEEVKEAIEKKYRNFHPIK